MQPNCWTLPVRLGLILLGLFWLNTPGSAQILSGGSTLKEPMGARQAGMGEAFAALSGDLNGIPYNPAGLANLPAPVISSMYTSNMFLDRNAHLAFGLPVSWLGAGALAGGITTLMGAEMQINNLDGTSETIISQNDVVGLLAYGHQFTKAIQGGISLKVYRSTLVEAYTATALAGDAGLLYQVGDIPGVSVGLAVQNLGKEINYLDQGDPLPSALRIGLAYQHQETNLHHLDLASDFIFPNDSDPYCNLGVEYAWQNTFFARAGYKLGYDLTFLTFGLGLQAYGFQLDYAFSNMEIGNQVHRFSLSFVFSDPAPAPSR